MLGAAAGHSPALHVQPPRRSSPTLAALGEDHPSESKSKSCFVDYSKGKGAEMLLLQMLAPVPHLRSLGPAAPFGVDQEALTCLSVTGNRWGVKYCLHPLAQTILTAHFLNSLL